MIVIFYQKYARNHRLFRYHFQEQGHRYFSRLLDLWLIWLHVLGLGDVNGGVRTLRVPVPSLVVENLSPITVQSPDCSPQSGGYFHAQCT
jgi:hypothetical protein